MRSLCLLLGLPVILLAVLQCGKDGGNGDADAGGDGDADSDSDGGGNPDGGGYPDGGQPDGGGYPDGGQPDGGGGDNPFEGHDGFWSGDGGCQIYSFDVTSVESDGLHCDQFGENEAVVFAYDPEDPSLASADALIMFHIEGHTCELRVTSDGLNLSCSNDDGGSCSEDFERSP